MIDFFAGVIMALWTCLIIFWSWKKERKPGVNITVGLLTNLILLVIYWVPFWMIFLH